MIIIVIINVGAAEDGKNFKCVTFTQMCTIVLLYLTYLTIK